MKRNSSTKESTKQVLNPNPINFKLNGLNRLRLIEILSDNGKNGRTIGSELEKSLRLYSDLRINCCYFYDSHLAIPHSQEHEKLFKIMGKNYQISVYKIDDFQIDLYIAEYAQKVIEELIKLPDIEMC